MSIPFPEGPADGDIFFHGELVCSYLQAKNTWECRRITPLSSGVTARASNDKDVLAWDANIQDWVAMSLTDLKAALDALPQI